MLLYLMNELQRNKLEIDESIINNFIEPSLSFFLTKEDEGSYQQDIIGISDEATGESYIIFDHINGCHIINSKKISYTKIQKEVFDSRVEAYILQMLNSGYNLDFMDLDFHASLWDFIDEFIYEVNYYENGLYKYLNYCDKTGVQYKTLITHSNQIICMDVLHHFHNVEFRNYGVILNQHIDNQYLLLGTNFDENKKRYYAVMLLDNEHQILEKKVHSKLNASINDFNNRFYDLKIKEQKVCEKFINQSIQEQVEFLKERNEEVE